MWSSSITLWMHAKCLVMSYSSLHWFIFACCMCLFLWHSSQMPRWCRTLPVSKTLQNRLCCVIFAPCLVLVVSASLCFPFGFLLCRVKAQTYCARQPLCRFTDWAATCESEPWAAVSCVGALALLCCGEGGQRSALWYRVLRLLRGIHQVTPLWNNTPSAPSPLSFFDVFLRAQFKKWHLSLTSYFDEHICPCVVCYQYFPPLLPLPLTTFKQTQDTQGSDDELKSRIFLALVSYPRVMRRQAFGGLLVSPSMLEKRLSGSSVQLSESLQGSLMYRADDRPSGTSVSSFRWVTHCWTLSTPSGVANDVKGFISHCWRGIDSGSCWWNAVPSWPADWTSLQYELYAKNEMHAIPNEYYLSLLLGQRPGWELWSMCRAFSPVLVQQTVQMQ